MGPGGTLGPIDPQFNDIPAREIQRAFKRLEEKVKEEGPEALTTYMPQIRKYDLTILDQCETAQDLSEELARHWLITYMFKKTEEAFDVGKIIEVLTNYELQKSHARSIGREKAHALGLKVKNIEDKKGLSELVQSLYNQYEFVFDRTHYYKLFENAYGIAWGRRTSGENPPGKENQ